MHLAAVRYCIKCLDTPSCFDEFHLHIYIVTLCSVRFGSKCNHKLNRGTKRTRVHIPSSHIHNILLLHIITKINVSDYWLNVVSFAEDGWIESIDRWIDSSETCKAIPVD